MRTEINIYFDNDRNPTTAMFAPVAYNDLDYEEAIKKAEERAEECGLEPIDDDVWIGRPTNPRGSYTSRLYKTSNNMQHIVVVERS